ncbi:Putative NAD(P)H-dependent FMN-containing oxidoreductase YwqN [Sporomusa ovata DSM 2662]|uniref:Iron-sulfur flavoprotein n=1 Tax=Sporomusa ovata TaxID=2378 RepID=A0A0U1KY43_9FIRM|nr:flavodoxin family protein [Sporomusa ovata]EQB28676.1 NADPH-dependent FMN reductase [Sporomusa ovata DSM 2662]CQR72185.1 iron-sulfur flavoprotein [Sporomusa ovata]
MSKNVLILSASPRKEGNSDLLCGQFMLGAKEASNRVEKIYLQDKTIGYCTGCGACYVSHKCVQTDDMAEILDKMIAADVIVMATPVYFYTMNAQMKTLIDRTVPRYQEITDREFYFIVAAADSNKDAMERTIDGFRGFLECLNGAQEKGIIYGVGAWHKGDIVGSTAMKQAYEVGRKV